MFLFQIEMQNMTDKSGTGVMAQGGVAIQEDTAFEHNMHYLPLTFWDW